MQNNKDLADFRKIMIIGAVQAGKTSLAARINGTEEEVRKTQALTYSAFTIDTPGEYIENPRMYKYIIAAAQNADKILFVQDATQKRAVYPPGFARCFNCVTIGVITKADGEEKDIEMSMKFLRDAGISGPIFITSAKTGFGIDELKSFLFGK